MCNKKSSISYAATLTNLASYQQQAVQRKVGLSRLDLLSDGRVPTRWT